jgi:uncharacterized membrane protein
MVTSRSVSLPKASPRRRLPARGAKMGQNLSASSPRDLQEQQLASCLGWLSIGLGATELVAPKAIAEFVGIREKDGLLPLFGLREIGSGIGILISRHPAAALCSRVLGDLLDLAYLTSAMSSPHNDHVRLTAAIASVLGVTAVDIVAAELNSRRPRAVSPPSANPGLVCIRKTITINHAQQELYEFWRDFENFPRFMSHLKEVQTLEGNKSRWIAHGPAGSSVEWDAEVTEEIPNRKITWQSTSGTIKHHGSVSFQAAPGGRGTEIAVELVYHPPGGALGRGIAWLSGEEPDFQIQEDLRRFKQMVETGEVATTEGQPTGRGRSWVPGM